MRNDADSFLQQTDKSKKKAIDNHVRITRKYK